MTVAVHPDDETLGCGGTLLKHAKAGASLHWLLLTSMSQDDFPAEDIKTQATQVEEVEKLYPFSSLDWLRLPTTCLGEIGLNRIIPPIQECIEKIRPDIVYIPHWGDVHSDHRVAFDAVSAVLKSFYMRPYGVGRVLICEISSETDAAAPHARAPFVPNVFVDIGETIEDKLRIFSTFRTEVHAEPGPRSLSAIRAQARARGATVALQYAEAFMLLREIS